MVGTDKPCNTAAECSKMGGGGRMVMNSMTNHMAEDEWSDRVLLFPTDRKILH
jgi:hypothetical protein